MRVVGAPRWTAASLFQTQANASRGQPPPCCCTPALLLLWAACVVRAPGSGDRRGAAVQGESRDRDCVDVEGSGARIQHASLAGTRIWQHATQQAAARTRQERCSDASEPTISTSTGRRSITAPLG